MATTAVKDQQQTSPTMAGTATALIAAAACAGLLLFAPSPSVATPPEGDPKLHPGHFGHVASGKEYPGVPATVFHEALEAGEETYPTGPGGWAEEKSGAANNKRAVD